MKRYRWLEDGEMMQKGDQFTSDTRPTDPNDTIVRWRKIPATSEGKMFHSAEYRGTRRLVPENPAL